MRVLFILDEIFGQRERGLLERLEIGLADEGVRVVRAVPDSLGELPSGGLFVETVTYELRGLVVSRRARVARLLERAGGEGRAIDLVHAMGGGAWRFAAEVARAAGAPLAIEAWRAGLAGRVSSLRTLLGSEVQVRALCPDQSAVTEFDAAGLGGLAIATPWGVHIAETDRQILEPDRAIAIVVVGGGRDSRALAGAMEGVGRALGVSSDARIFMDADAARRARIYPTLDRLGLTERTSLIPDMEARRDLVLMGDLLISPEALGEHRTIVLDAMGAGMAVVAAADPRVSWLVEGVTARLVSGVGWRADAPPESGPAPSGTPDDWARVLGELLASPERARALGAAARAFVRENRRASAHVAAVLAAYAQMTGAASPSLAFPTA